MMTVEEKPDITYQDLGGVKEQIKQLREVVELPMLQPELFMRVSALSARVPKFPLLLDLRCGELEARDRAWALPSPVSAS
jgi:SpoVK/Ycf46/Vps4 family AAA+-type ATPase